jgi:anti-anti-sigma factor
MLTFNYNSEVSIITLSFTGRMDFIAAGKVEEIMLNEPYMKNLKPGDNIVFDLKEVDYIASSFIRICVSQAKKVGRSRFSITNCQPFVKKTFKISGLDDILNVH